METALNIIDEIYEKCTEKQCKKCVSVHFCQFMKKYCESGADLAEQFKNGAFKENPVIPYSCNLCALCEKVCPQHLDIGKMCLEVRERMVEEGLGPMPRHKEVLNEQEWVASDAYALTLPPPDGSECKRFLFPGCGLSSYSPDLVIKTFNYLQERLPGTGILLRCCGAPLHQIGEKKRFKQSLDRLRQEMDKYGTSELVVGCADCKHTFQGQAPDIQVTSIYEIMAEYGLPEGMPEPIEKPFSLHDCCKSRYDDKLRESARKIVGDTGNTIEEMKLSGEKTRCCGMGGLIAYADFKFAMQVIKARVAEMPHDALAYCASCRNAFAMVGKPATHVLDLIFNPEWEKTKKHPGKQGPAKQKILAGLRERLVNEYSVA
jgi:Fe-S oxidoreductase